MPPRPGPPKSTHRPRGDAPGPLAVPVPKPFSSSPSSRSPTGPRPMVTVFGPPHPGPGRAGARRDHRIAALASGVWRLASRYGQGKRRAVPSGSGATTARTVRPTALSSTSASASAPVAAKPPCVSSRRCRDGAVVRSAGPSARDQGQGPRRGAARRAHLGWFSVAPEA